VTRQNEARLVKGPWSLGGTMEVRQAEPNRRFPLPMRDQDRGDPPSSCPFLPMAEEWLARLVEHR
jgi:hypothetical protein